MRVLIVEDDHVCATQCVDLLKKLGTADVNVTSTVGAALLLLDDIADGKIPPLDLIVLDLGFYIESGFEVLRRWREEPKLRAIPIIVWTVMGETEQSICGYFGVQKVVPKWAGMRELEVAVTSIRPPGEQIPGF